MSDRETDGIPDSYRESFDNLRRAFMAGDTCLIQCIDKVTGRHAYVVCAINVDAAARDSGAPHIQLVPFARMDDDLHLRMTPPSDMHIHGDLS